MNNQYLTGSGISDLPTFSIVIFTLLLALLLSTGIALTYKLAFQDENLPKQYLHSITLSAIISAAIMMIVGDNLAVGFALLTAIFITRFKALIKYPRITIFIFASLSVGIATGKFSYAIAISGTFLFCYIVVLLYCSPAEDDQE